MQNSKRKRPNGTKENMHFKVIHHVKFNTIIFIPLFLQIEPLFLRHSLKLRIGLCAIFTIFLFGLTFLQIPKISNYGDLFELIGFILLCVRLGTENYAFHFFMQTNQILRFFIFFLRNWIYNFSSYCNSLLCYQKPRRLVNQRIQIYPEAAWTV